MAGGFGFGFGIVRNGNGEDMVLQQDAIFCADIGGSFIKLGVSARRGQVREVLRLPTPGNDWHAFRAALASAIASQGDTFSPDAPLGLSIAGLVDPVTGAAFSANIGCITGRRLAEELSDHLSRPVLAANDADCLTLAEAGEGAGRGHAVVFCAIMGTGIGGGLAMDGRLIRGAGGVSGEWGHGPILATEIFIGQETVRVPRLACGCGQSGCVDTIGGARGLERLHRVLHAVEVSSHDLLASWQAGDAAAARTLAVWRDLVADPLALVVNMTGASIVPVGGGLGSVAPLVAMLDEAVRARILTHFGRPLVVPAVHQAEGGLMGAAVLARSALDARAAPLLGAQP